MKKYSLSLEIKNKIIFSHFSYAIHYLHINNRGARWVTFNFEHILEAFKSYLFFITRLSHNSLQSSGMDTNSSQIALNFFLLFMTKYVFSETDVKISYLDSNLKMNLPALLVFRLTSDTGIGEASFTDADAPLPPEPDPLLSPVAAAVPFELFPVDADE